MVIFAAFVIDAMHRISGVKHMSYTRMYDLLPELAMKETSMIEVGSMNAYSIPAGKYGLVEMYCDDKDCDCRRVLIAVMLEDSGEPLAVISFGWESLDFYTKWFNMGKEVPFRKMDYIDRYAVQSMHGVCLNASSRQNEIASALLEMVKARALTDRFYLSRLKQHYKLFRAKVDEKHRRNNVVEFSRRPK
jgi:hypothetical protein